MTVSVSLSVGKTQAPCRSPTHRTAWTASDCVKHSSHTKMSFLGGVWFLNLMEAVCVILSKQNVGGYQETCSCARNIFISFLSLINISLFTGTQSMTKQVPSKHVTTRTVISILPLATFHQ